MSELHTARMVLEPLRVDHADFAFHRLQDPALYTYIPGEPPQTLEDVRRRYAKLASRELKDGDEHWLNWVGRQSELGEYVGVFEATVRPGEHAYVAYTVFVPFQRRGYAREGLAEVIDCIMREYDLHRVLAEIDTRNHPSIKLVESLGFRLVSERPNVDFFKGHVSDEFLYELTRNHWLNGSDRHCG